MSARIYCTADLERLPGRAERRRADSRKVWACLFVYLLMLGIAGALT